MDKNATKTAPECTKCGDKGYVEFVWQTGFMRGYRCTCPIGKSGS